MTKRVLLATLFLSGAALAADAPAGPTPRTLASLIAAAEDKGEFATVGPPMSANLGFKKAFAGKTLFYSSEKTPDKRAHGLTVVRENGKVAALVWDNTLYEGATLDGMTYRSTAAGRLVCAVHAHGQLGRVAQDKVGRGSAETKKAFQREVDFFATETAALDGVK